MEDLYRIGGVPGVQKYLLEKGLLDGDQLTVTGKTLAENLSSSAPLIDNNGQDIIRMNLPPVKESGHIQILYGNVAPEGSVAKITGKEGVEFTGSARCFDNEEQMALEVLKDPQHYKGTVIVIRYEGPKGGPGMPEMLNPTGIIMGAGLGNDCALITDGRFSGGSHGFVIGHIVPEAQVGGPIGLIKDGDTIEISVAKK